MGKRNPPHRLITDRNSVEEFVVRALDTGIYRFAGQATGSHNKVWGSMDRGVE
jgi:hypothetical protein